VVLVESELDFQSHIVLFPLEIGKGNGSKVDTIRQLEHHKSAAYADLRRPTESTRKKEDKRQSIASSVVTGLVVCGP
jgi:formate-dependent phosphoribosylglycinamide formyltransferase (GAR transformylase)